MTLRSKTFQSGRASGNVSCLGLYSLGKTCWPARPMPGGWQERQNTKMGYFPPEIVSTFPGTHLRSAVFVNFSRANQKSVPLAAPYTSVPVEAEHTTVDRSSKRRHN